MCGVVLLGGFFLLDINQVQMEVEVKMPHIFCYKQLSFSVFLGFVSFEMLLVTLEGRMP
jgi:hypothetical protein